MKLLFVILTSLIINTAHAGTPLSLVATISYQTTNEQHLPVSSDLQTYFNLSTDTDQTTWVEIARTQASSDPANFIVLSKLKHANSTHATIDFIIIDHVKEKSTVITPSIQVAYGSKKEVTLKTKFHTLQFQLLANK